MTANSSHLRHEVAILRSQIKRADLFPMDRTILAALGRHLPLGGLLFSPATLKRWHRELVSRKWAAFSYRPRRGRPPIPDEIRNLILTIAKDNPRWGEQRCIQPELLKLRPSRIQLHHSPLDHGSLVGNHRQRCAPISRAQLALSTRRPNILSIARAASMLSPDVTWVTTTHPQ